MFRLSYVTLILANLAPLVGVHFFGWSLFAVMLLFWLENGIIGIWNLAKIATAKGGETDMASATPMGRIWMGIGFTVHYGGFWAGHGLMVFTVFATNSDPSWSMFVHEVTQTGIIWALVGMVFSHGQSFFSNFLGRGEYKVATSGTLMAGPYARLGILHIIVFIGAHKIESMGSPPTALLFLVLSKTVIDLCSHAVAHARAHPEKRHAQLMKFLLKSVPGKGLHTFRTEAWVACAVEIFADDRLMQKFAQQLSALIVHDCKQPPEIRIYALSPVLGTSDGASPGLQQSRTAILSRRIFLLEMLAMKPPEDPVLREQIGGQLLHFARFPLAVPQFESAYSFLQNPKDYSLPLVLVSDPAGEEAAFQEALARYLLPTNLVTVSS